MAKKIVNVHLVLDMSGSMFSILTDAIGGTNSYLANLRKDKTAKYVITLTGFDSENEKLRLKRIFDHVPLKDAREITEKDYVPDGFTPLYDAIMTCASYSEKDENVIMVIMTDGAENDSHEYSGVDVKKRLEALAAKGWGIVYLGANQDSFGISKAIGINPTNVANYDVTNFQGMTEVAAKATMRYAISGQSTNLIDPSEYKSLAHPNDLHSASK